MQGELKWILFPRSKRPCPALRSVIRAFELNLHKVRSDEFTLESNEVLKSLSDDLQAAGFKVEISKRAEDKIAVPVLFGRNGTIEKSFLADGFHELEGVVLEIEAGRAVSNNQFLKDLFQACMMQDAKHLAICVRSTYRGADDFESVYKFFDTLYASHRVQLPLESILIIGY